MFEVNINMSNNGYQFYIIERLPRGLDIVLGEDWLDKNHIMIQNEIGYRE